MACLCRLFFPMSHVNLRKAHVATFLNLCQMSLRPMSPCQIKKLPCCCVDFRGQHPLQGIFLCFSSKSGKDPTKTNSMAFIYEKVTACLTKPPHERDKDELNVLEPWVRKKSKLFAALQRGMTNSDIICNKARPHDVLKFCCFSDPSIELL